jgi:hypothetical protein
MHAAVACCCLLCPPVCCPLLWQWHLQVKQPELVKDALRLVQGLTGKYSSLNSSLSADLAAARCGICVAPQEQLLLPIGMRTLLHELGELGLLYQ